MKTVQDAYATLEARPYTGQTHPFVTYLRFTDGTHSQPINSRTLADCLKVGNGMLSALAAVGVPYQTVNVVFDPRFDRTQPEV